MNRLLRSPWFIGLALVAAVGFAPASARAQAVLRGRITTNAGQPASGASVGIVELNVGATVDASGSYSLLVPAARVSGQTVVLRARQIGYKPQNRTITITSGTQTNNFVLEKDVQQLATVVTTGVATATEQIKVPFAVTRVDSSQMPVQGSNPLSQLQGKIPGALIVSASGRPGAAPSIVLRGPVSLNATGRSQSPLYLVDGVPLQSCVTTSTLPCGGLPDLNPADIESIEVLKGASAASLYGAQAGAGVISITTKSGRNALPGVTFGLRTEIGQGDIERNFPLAQHTALALDPTGTFFCTREVVGGSPCARYIDWDKEVQRINNSGEDFSNPPQLFLRDFGIASAPAYDQLTGVFQVNSYPQMRDPVSQVVTPSAYANTNLDVRGKVNNTGFFASFGNSTQQGAVRYLSGYRRNSLRLNVDQTFGEKLSGTVNSAYSQTRDDASNFDETSGNAGTWFNLTRAPWMADLTGTDNLGRVLVRHNPLSQGDQNFNPVYSLAYNRRVNQGSRFVGSTSLRYSPITWLNVDGNFGYDRQTGVYTSERDRGWRTTSSDPNTSSGFIGNGNTDNAQLNFTLNGSAKRTFFTDLNATLATRYSYNDQTIKFQDLSGTGLVVAGLETADAATANYSVGSTTQKIKDAGYYISTDLDYKDRYILGLLGRRDGSSLFGSGQRWQTFGRVSGAWIASREPWWPAPNAISLLKLHGSRGSTGQRPRFSAQYETFTIGTGGTLNPLTIGNKNLKPEINTETEIGADLELFNRYGLVVTHAQSVIDGQILPVRPSTATGFQSQYQNAGEITNKTWEGTLTVPIITRGAFTWTARVIGDQTISTITRLDVPEFVGTITPGPTNTFDIFKFRQGERIGTVYGFDYVKDCNQLPAGFASQCSNNGSDLAAAYRPNGDGYIVWLGAGNTPGDGITKNLWRARTGIGNGPWGNNTNWGMPITLRDSTSNIAFVPLGSGLPKFHMGVSQTFDYKRINVYGLLDSYFGQKIWNIAYHWSLGDLQSSEVDQNGKSVEDARPIGYYWRRGPSSSPGGNSGVGGLYDALNPSSYSFEDNSYTKLRELQVNFHVGPVGGTGDWRLGLVGRNLYTWTKFRGFDPEGGNTTGPLASSALTPVTGYRFPNLRTYTVQLSSSF
jgi:TonB-linked SusC/RagA family outer membrane protein